MNARAISGIVIYRESLFWWMADTSLSNISRLQCYQTLLPAFHSRQSPAEWSTLRPRCVSQLYKASLHANGSFLSLSSSGAYLYIEAVNVTSFVDSTPCLIGWSVGHRAAPHQYPRNHWYAWVHKGHLNEERLLTDYYLHYKPLIWGNSIDGLLEPSPPVAQWIAFESLFQKSS